MITWNEPLLWTYLRYPSLSKLPPMILKQKSKFMDTLTIFSKIAHRILEFQDQKSSGLIPKELLHGHKVEAKHYYNHYPRNHLPSSANYGASILKRKCTPWT